MHHLSVNIEEILIYKHPLNLRNSFFWRFGLNLEYFFVNCDLKVRRFALKKITLNMRYSLYHNYLGMNLFSQKDKKQLQVQYSNKTFLNFIGDLIWKIQLIENFSESQKKNYLPS